LYNIHQNPVIVNNRFSELNKEGEDEEEE